MVNRDLPPVVTVPLLRSRSRRRIPVPSLDYDRIKSEIKLREVLDHLGWRPIWSCGERRRGPCPIHGSTSERSRIFAVSGDRWFCHKCKVGGGWLELWMRIYKLSVYPATLNACAALGRTAHHLQHQAAIAADVNGEEESYIDLTDHNWTPE